MNHNEEASEPITEPRSTVGEFASEGRSIASGDTSSLDPVCQMTIDAQFSEHTLDYAGRRFVFCSEGCRLEFLRHSEEYIQSGLR